MVAFHRTTFDLMGDCPPISAVALTELERAEQRLGIRLPASVRDWYSRENALRVLADHSNDDPPIPVDEFILQESTFGRIIPVRRENQGVCTWAILVDGSDDPAVLVEVDSNCTKWQMLAPNFSTYVYTCVWDHRVVFGQPVQVAAQNGPISPQALEVLASSFDEGPRTFGSPGSVQYRFAGSRQGVLVWSAEGHSADWWVGAADASSLEAALRAVWDLDGVGGSFYECSGGAESVLSKLKADVRARGERQGTDGTP